MKVLLTIIFFNFYSVNSFAVDCFDIGLKKMPQLKICDPSMEKGARRECVLSIIEKPLHSCLEISEAITRNKCILFQTVELIAMWPIECVQDYRKDIITRIEQSEKKKYGKSSYEINEELKKKYKEQISKNTNMKKVDNKDTKDTKVEKMAP